MARYSSTTKKLDGVLDTLDEVIRLTHQEDGVDSRALRDCAQGIRSVRNDLIAMDYDADRKRKK